MAAKKKTATAKKTAKSAVFGTREDFGKPVDSFFDKHAPPIRASLERLRALVQEVAPSAEATLKWGQPFYTLDGEMFCALSAHKAHVNLIIAGPPDTFADPKGLLEGDGKTGRHLKVTDASAIPVADVKKWLKASAALAKQNSRG